MGHKSVREAKRKISFPEFIRWQKYFDNEVNHFHREDWFGAQIAFQVYLLRHTVLNMFNPDPQSPELDFKQFLIKFIVKDEKSEGETPVEVQETPEQRKRRIMLHRQAWFAACGLRPDGTAPPNPKGKKKKLKSLPLKVRERTERKKEKQNGP